MVEVDPQVALTFGVFTRRQARAAGCSPEVIARRLRTGEWRATEFGLYEDVGRIATEHDRLIRRLLRAGPRAVTSHLTAAQALGWDLLKPPPLQFTVPRSNGSAKSKGATLFRRNLDDDEIEAIGAALVTNPLRTALDVAGDVPLVEAVVAVDAALRLRQVTVEGLLRAAEGRKYAPRYRQVRRVLALVDPQSGSVPESVARLLFTNAGLPSPETQFVVCAEDGSFVARTDFAWPGAWLVVEIDGFAWHSSEQAFQADRDRQNEIEIAEYMVLRFTAKDVRDRPEKVTDTVRRALRKRG
jgi:hypothetical protein